MLYSRFHSAFGIWRSLHSELTRVQNSVAVTAQEVGIHRHNYFGCIKLVEHRSIRGPKASSALVALR